jgi:phospholipase C
MSAFQRNINHVVVLMLENRSYDHLLGFSELGEGLKGDEFNFVDPAAGGEKVSVSSDAAYLGDLDVDPSHRLLDINVQLFGTVNPPATPPGPGAHNSGFVLNYGQQPDNTPLRAKRIMKCFAPDRLPSLTTLAREFVVCDHWFSSVPAQTWPNRFFVHAATSQGEIDNTPRIYDARTIYDNLAAKGEDWRIYFHDMPQSVMLASLRQRKFRKNFSVFNERFKVDCKAGLLASYSFIEPRYFDFGALKANDQHPPHDVALGDRLIADVYEAIRNSPVWDSTLLFILWDEHGGIFDHVLPQATVNPDERNHSDPNFDFKRLGLRVPAVIVSPWVEKGVVDTTVYDHTSVLASLRDLFELPSSLTARDASANTVERLVTDTKRTDAPTKLDRATPAIATSAVVTSSAMTPAELEASRTDQSEAPLSEFQQSLVDAARELPTDDPRIHAAQMMADPKTEHDGAVHVRQAMQNFVGSVR